jgi:hypothetical protein
MNKLRNFLRWLQLNLTNLPLKNDEIDQSIPEDVHIPKLNESIEKILPEIGDESELLVSVSESSFKIESHDEFQRRLEGLESTRSKNDAEAYNLYFSNEYPKFIRDGFICVDAERIEFDLIELTKCIWDEGGNDPHVSIVKPAYYIRAYANLKGELISPFAFKVSNINQNIKNWLTLQMNPLDEAGKVRLSRYDTIEESVFIDDCFIVEKDKKFGLIDKNMNEIIPIQYKLLDMEYSGLIKVKTQNDLVGILNPENKFVIPPAYNYLSYIVDGKYKGYYHTQLNGVEGYLDKNNIFHTPESLSGNEDLLKQMSEGIQTYESAFSSEYNGHWFQSKILKWSELVIFLKYHFQHDHYCYLPVDKDNRILWHLDDEKHKGLYKDGHLKIDAKWYRYKNGGVIGVWITLDSGDCGDEQGFGVEFGEYYTAILDEDGNYLLPFTNVKDREAQWQSLLYDIEWKYMNDKVRKEFEAWQKNQEK